MSCTGLLQAQVARTFLKKKMICKINSLEIVGIAFSTISKLFILHIVWVFLKMCEQLVLLKTIYFWTLLQRELERMGFPDVFI